MTKISVMSPIHNEEGNIRELVRRTTGTMRRCCGSDWEFLLVDDLSTDSSYRIMKELAKGNKNLVVLQNKKKSGQTGCFQNAFDNAKGSIIITMDGDLEVFPEDLPLFIDKILNHDYDVVNAIREQRRHPFFIKLASRIYYVLMLLFFDCPVHDSASNYTAIKIEFVRNLKMKGNDHRYIIPLVMSRGAKKIGEVVIRHARRTSGKSKYKALPKFIKGFPEIFIFWAKFKMGLYKR